MPQIARIGHSPVKEEEGTGKAKPAERGNKGDSTPNLLHLG
jgi:hypothetical protein